MARKEAPGTAGLRGCIKFDSGRSKVATPSRVLSNFDSSAIRKNSPVITHHFSKSVPSACVGISLAIYLLLTDQSETMPRYLGPGDNLNRLNRDSELLEQLRTVLVSA